MPAIRAWAPNSRPCKACSTRLLPPAADPTTLRMTMTLHRRALLALLAAFAVTTGVQAQTPNPRVKLTTSLGDIVLELDAAKAPKTVENFLQYVNDKHYDSTVFHRVI